jgi:hypothetical protein
MRTNTLVVLIGVAIIGGSSIALARSGGGGGGSGMGHGAGMGHGSGIGHGHFGRRFFPRFLRNQVFFGDGWGWGWSPGYGGDTNVLVQQSVPRFSAADVTASNPVTRCRWNAETFNVPSSAGGKRPVEVVSCR